MYKIKFMTKQNKRLFMEIAIVVFLLRTPSMAMQFTDEIIRFIK